MPIRNQPRNRAFALLLLLVGTASCAFAFLPRHHKTSPTAEVIVESEKPGCSVDVDGVAAGKTGANRRLDLAHVAPSAHYIHVDCPGQPEATAYIAPLAGSTTRIEPVPDLSFEGGGPSGFGRAENNLELRDLLTQAANDRSSGHFPEAIQTLRKAIQLDPENPGLHHELGMTFLMIREWENAAVELREAVRRDPAGAGAHNELGYALEKMGDLEAALDQFRAATRLDPDDASYQDHYLEARAMLSAQQRGKTKRR